MIVEDSPFSSDAGSGFRSPIFGAQFPRSDSSGKPVTTSRHFISTHVNKVCYYSNHIDIRSAAGILSSQIDSNYPSHTLPLSTAPRPSIDPQTPHHQHSHQYAISPHNHLGPDIYPPKDNVLLPSNAARQRRIFDTLMNNRDLLHRSRRCGTLTDVEDWLKHTPI